MKSKKHNQLMNVTKKKSTHRSDLENKSVVTSGERERGKGNIRVED